MGNLFKNDRFGLVITIILFVLRVEISLCEVSITTTCLTEENKALHKFKQSLIDPSNRLASWDEQEQDCCKWRGIKCDETHRHVVTIDLRNVQVDFSTALLLANNEFDSSLLELKHLNYLDLSGNFFNLSQIPKFFGSIQELTYLNLSRASFGGVVPPHLGNLTKLHTLDLAAADKVYDHDHIYNNYIYYDIQKLFTQDVEWISRLSSLRHLDLSGMDLGKTHNLMKVLNNLPSLQLLSLAKCGIQTSQFLHDALNFTSVLRVLDLSNNEMNGSIPGALQKMTSLTALDLSFNNFSSSIPHWLGDIRNLVWLDFNYNQFSGIEGGLLAIINNMCKVKVLKFGFNSIQGDAIQSHKNLSGCVKYDMEKLDLSFNRKLEGDLRDWLSELKQLKFVDLSYNSLHGSIPPSIGNLTYLENLWLNNNHLQGMVPTELGQLRNLETLDLSSNLLEGAISEFHFSNLSKLNYLGMGGNRLDLNMKSNWVPPFQLQDISMRSSQIGTLFPQWLKTQKQLCFLDLSNNSIMGTVPNWLWELKSLVYLDLSYNKINGSVLHSIRGVMLQTLILKGNLIDGSIPISFCELTILIVLDISENKLIGELPNCFGKIETLVIMAITSNGLSGKVPPSIGNLSQLQVLQLSNNHFNGELPISLKKCEYLRVLDIGENSFSGNIPIWIESLQQLQVLRVSKNKFEGEIPMNLCLLSHLRILDLSHNSFNGTIPQCLGNLKSMQGMTFVDQSGLLTLLNMPSMFDPVDQVLKGNNLKYSKTLGFILNMDLSMNNLVGTIPEELTKLVALVGLNLSHNDISGTIPMDIGKMKALESLDLSDNKLHGGIPTSMVDLKWLGFLNLSTNNLSGPIPKGTQLQSFDFSYLHNPYLCGKPLVERCFGENPNPNPNPNPSKGLLDDQKSHQVTGKFENMWLYISIVLGYAVGFWGVIGVLIVKKTFRYAYFQLADDIKEWLFDEMFALMMRIKTLFV